MWRRSIWKSSLKHSLPFCVRDIDWWNFIMRRFVEEKYVIATAVTFASRSIAADWLCFCFYYFYVLNFYIHNFNDQQLWVNGIHDTLNKINWKLHFMAIKCAIHKMLVCSSCIASLWLFSWFIWENFSTAKLEETRTRLKSISIRPVASFLLFRFYHSKFLWLLKFWS
jgi:hypothetical protein